jgi:hypothetical protein
MRLSSLFVVLFLIANPVQIDAASSGTTSPAMVGAYYFGGWTPALPHVTEKLRTEFADREPVWGWYDDDPATMRREIDYAADGGLSFFSFCWYWTAHEPQSASLNNSLNFYLQAPNRDRLKFCLMVANHGGFAIGPADWPAVTAQWVALFRQPTYLRVEGKPLLVIFAPDALVKAFGGLPPLRKALDDLRAQAIKAGLPGVTIAGCINPDWKKIAWFPEAGFDVMTAYSYHSALPARPGRAQAFADTIPAHETIWNRVSRLSPLPYIPAVTTGWDRRPWEGDPAHKVVKAAVYYPDRTPAEVGALVHEAVRWVDQHSERAVPERVVVLYAWNELGEGGFIAPTKAQGTAYLDAIKKAIQTPPAP